MQMLNSQFQNKGTGRGGARDRTAGTTTRVTEYNDRSSTNQTRGDEQDDSSLYETRTPSSARRYHPSDRRDQRSQQGKPKVARASAQPRTQSMLPISSVRRQRWTGSVLLLPVGIGMCLMLVLWIGGNWLLSVGQSLQDEMHYGDTRTFQIDAMVGHQDSAAHPSHFIALNLHGRIEVIEFPGGDPTHAKIYLGPVLYGKLKDQAVVTLTFKDINADGKVDMIIDVRDGVRIPFLNDGGQFRAVQPGEQTHLKI